MAPATSLRAEGRLAGLLILVAEDHADSLDALRQMLEYEGAVVLAAENGRAALEQLRRSPRRPDVMLIDLMMPVLDGFQLAHQLHTGAPWAGIPLVAVTARVAMADYRATLEAGFVAHIAKPIDMDALVATVTRVHQASAWRAARRARRRRTRAR